MNPAAKIIERYQQAVFDKNVEAFCALYSKQAVVFDAWSCWKYADLASWQKNVHEWLSSIPKEERVRVTFKDTHTATSGDLITLNSTVTYGAEDAAGAPLRSLQNRISWIIEKGLVVHEHTSFPVDGASLKATLHE